MFDNTLLYVVRTMPVKAWMQVISLAAEKAYLGSKDSVPFTAFREIGNVDRVNVFYKMQN